MRAKISLIVLTSTLAIAGCASTDSPDTTAKSETVELTEQQKIDLGYKCEKILVTGSRYPKKVCSTEAQRQARALKDQEMLRRATGGGTGSPAGNG